ncbi:hypothetical protein THIOM_005412 [Candidatus Thiomargarita nelsonii]|uniref:Uncharacterized protein n=1 Tax=Candidatus Thiomargarita nelsonii TaxID=1003181 RepID=A0A176RTB2_9GAMM|nr:hypothetical protein THIOM_005412 [Candidatus Thiomargarita nelsonii]
MFIGLGKRLLSGYSSLVHHNTIHTFKGVISMQDIKQTQITQPQEQATDSQTAQPTYMPPKIKMFKEKDMLKMALVFGCSLQAM